MLATDLRLEQQLLDRARLGVVMVVFTKQSVVQTRPNKQQRHLLTLVLGAVGLAGLGLIITEKMVALALLFCVIYLIRQ